MSETQEASIPEPPFFAVGRAKYVALSLSTFSLYQFVWLWQHWRHRRNAVGERVLPTARSLLFPWLFTIPLGYRIAKAGVAAKTAGWPPALTAAVLWTLFSVGSACLPKGPWSLLVMSLVLPGVWLQALANRVNEAVVPTHERNLRFTFANKVVVVIGGIWVLLAAAGLFLRKERVTVEEHERTRAAEQRDAPDEARRPFVRKASLSALRR